MSDLLDGQRAILKRHGVGHVSGIADPVDRLHFANLPSEVSVLSPQARSKDLSGYQLWADVEPLALNPQAFEDADLEPVRRLELNEILSRVARERFARGTGDRSLMSDSAYYRAIDDLRPFLTSPWVTIVDRILAHRPQALANAI